MQVCAIIQARMGSTRLPGKVMMQILNRPIIWHLINQISFSEEIDKIVLATTTNKEDDCLYEYGVEQGWGVFRGSSEDVLDRYYKVAEENGLKEKDAIVRLTGDDILPDPKIIDQLVSIYKKNKNKIKHVSNNRILSYPYGSDLEVFSFEALQKAWQESKLPYEREHVTPYIRNHPSIFPYLDIVYHTDFSNIFLSIDTINDLNFNEKLMTLLYENGDPPFHLEVVLSCITNYNLHRE